MFYDGNSPLVAKSRLIEIVAEDKDLPSWGKRRIQFLVQGGGRAIAIPRRVCLHSVSSILTYKSGVQKVKALPFSIISGIVDPKGPPDEGPAPSTPAGPRRSQRKRDPPRRLGVKFARSGGASQKERPASKKGPGQPKPQATKSKQPKPAKDPNAPEKPQSAYMIFAAEKKVSIIRDDPEITTTDMMRAIGASWKALGKKDKEIYKTKAKAAKAEFATATRKYKDNTMVNQKK